MSGRQLLDANVIIRFLTEDHPIHSPKMLTLFQRAAAGELVLVLTEVCIAEVVWTLSSYYRLERGQIALWMTTLIQSAGIEVSNKTVMLAALQTYAKRNVDFVDNYHAAVAVAQELSVSSFDRDFDRIGNVRRIEPA